MATTNQVVTGKVVQISGPAVDCEFPEGQIPIIYTAIRITSEGFTVPTPIDIICEVQQHIGEGRVRTVALQPTEGLVRGMKAISLGGPISVPVGKRGAKSASWTERDWTLNATGAPGVRPAVGTGGAGAATAGTSPTRMPAATAQGTAGSLYYVFAYSFLVLGSFAVVAVVGSNGDTNNDLSRYRGLGRYAEPLYDRDALPVAI